MMNKKIIKMILPAFIIFTIGGVFIVGMVSHDLQKRITTIIASDLYIIMIYVLVASIIDSLKGTITYFKRIKIRKKPDGLILKDYLSLFFFGFNTAFFTFITPVYCILHEKVLYVTQ